MVFEDHFFVIGVENPGKLKKELWDCLNNRQKVSHNLLHEDLVQTQNLDNKSLLPLQVPRASRRQRPVFVGQNPLFGTFRRHHEGDYKCTPDEIGRMFADQTDEPADSRIVPRTGLQELDLATLRDYRNRLSSRAPTHPWLGLEDLTFLEKLGGWRRDAAKDETGLTFAGLMMFGREETIQAPDALPQYHLDYREPSPVPRERWLDRLTIDGTWAGNLFQFFYRAVRKLSADLKLPFQLDRDLFRQEDTIVHEAVREALVNALVHADYRGQGGIIIEKFPDRFQMSNPGNFLLPLEQIRQGGLSECWNKTLQKMFQLLGLGEKAGSGFDRIRQGWASQHWRLPALREQYRPDRVTLLLPMVSLLPTEVLDRLGRRFGSKFPRLPEVEVLALATADIEGAVTNARLREISESHPTDLTRTFGQNLRRRRQEKIREELTVTWPKH